MRERGIIPCIPAITFNDFVFCVTKPTPWSNIRFRSNGTCLPDSIPFVRFSRADISILLLRKSGSENSCVIQGKITLYSIKQAYEQIAVMGIVMTQAVTIRRTVSHWMAEAPRVAPTPKMAPVIAWVVETGTPNAVMNERTTPPDVSAQNP